MQGSFLPGFFFFCECFDGFSHIPLRFHDERGLIVASTRMQLSNVHFNMWHRLMNEWKTFMIRRVESSRVCRRCCGKMWIVDMKIKYVFEFSLAKSSQLNVWRSNERWSNDFNQEKSLFNGEIIIYRIIQMVENPCFAIFSCQFYLLWQITNYSKPLKCKNLEICINVCIFILKKIEISMN